MLGLNTDLKLKGFGDSSLSLSLSPSHLLLLLVQHTHTEPHEAQSENRDLLMAPPPGPYSGTNTLALVARVSAFSVGLVYGSMKLKYLQAKAKSHKKAEATAHH